MPDVINDPEYHELGQQNIREAGRSYDGRSDRKEHSDWRDLHLAIQRAAKSAAHDLDLHPGDEVWFEVSRLQVKVGNPNVKIFRAILTQSDAPPDN